MSNNFASHEFQEQPSNNELSNEDLEILSGNLGPVKERIEFHNLLRFINITLNSFGEEEETEEREE